MVVLGNLGFSPSGELYNCAAEDVASACAVQLEASKLVYMHNGEQLVDTRRENDSTILNLTLGDARTFIREGNLPEVMKKYLLYGVYACERGVRRTHFISRYQNGALLAELFTRDGAGLIISRDLYEGIRMAKEKDIHKIITLIKP